MGGVPYLMGILYYFYFNAHLFQPGHPIFLTAVFLSIEQSVFYFISLNSRHKHTLIKLCGVERLSVRRPGLKFQLPSITDYIPCAHLVTFPNLSFIICKWESNI